MANALVGCMRQHAQLFLGRHPVGDIDRHRNNVFTSVGMTGLKVPMDFFRNGRMPPEIRFLILYSDFNPCLIGARKSGGKAVSIQSMMVGSSSWL